MIFLGASSGADLGKVTVRTPFSIDALISSSCDHPLDIVPCETSQIRLAYLDSLWKLKSPRELPVAPLAHGVSRLLVLRRHLALSRDSQASVMHVDVNVLLLHAGELEGSGDEVLLLVLVKIHPISDASILCSS